MLKYFFITVFFFISINFLGQITVDSDISPEDAVQELLGDNVTISNFDFTGFNEQIGYFDCVDCGFDFTSGVILGTGDVALAEGPNDEGGYSLGGEFNPLVDEDLAQISFIDEFHDIAAMEFDFIALGDSITFNYTYASEEYHTFISENGIHDVFMLLISGPGISGPYSNNSENIALIPGTTQGVTNASINNGTDGLTGPCVNCEFFVYNGTGWEFDGDTQYTDETVVQYNGYTTGLSAVKGGLECGETYHLRIVIGDASDNGYDSAVIIESNSITSNLTVGVDFNVNIEGYGEGLAEGCGVGELLFTRPAGIPEELELELEVTYEGTATFGEDYNELPTQIYFASGQNEIAVEVVAYVDEEIGESVENVVVNVAGSASCAGESSISVYEFEILEIPPLEVELNPLFNLCGGDTTLAPIVTGGFGDLNHLWNNQFNTEVSDLNEVFVSLNQGDNEILYYTVTDVCSNSISVSTELFRLDSLELLIPEFLTGTCLTDFTIVAETNLNSSLIEYNWSGTMSDFLESNTNTASYQGSEGGTLTLEADAGCGNVTVDQTQIYISSPLITVTPSLDTTICLFGNAFLNVNGTGGAGELTYEWAGNGESYSNQNINVNPTSSALYEYIVTDECGSFVQGDIYVRVDNLDASIEYTDLGNNQFLFEAFLDEECSSCEYLWEFSDGSTSEEESPTNEFSDSGFISAAVTITAESSCSSYNNVYINVPPLIFIPNSFTPDNDGINDVWKPEVTGVDTYKLMVFNRWGKIVFETTNPDEAWTGNSKSGDYYVPNGLYSYVIEYTSLDLNSVSLSGTVTILR